MNNNLNEDDCPCEHPTVCIIMSTYNAMKYVEAQVDSILAQDNVEIKLWIRDDGSTDDTVALLNGKYGKDHRVTISCGENLGAAGSFMTALFACNLICDYYGFSDADDVWLSNKTEHSIGLLAELPVAEPAAVVTRLEVVNQELRPLGYTAVPERGLSFRNALIQTVASGAATTMNRAAFDKLRSACPKFVVMHDAWVYLVITAFGRFLYSDSPTLLYRQHATNVFGTGHSWRRRMAQRIGRLRHPVDAYRRQAEEFYRLFGHCLDAQKSRDIRRYLDYRSTFLRRVQFFIRPSILKQRSMANLYMRLLILLGKE